MIDRPLNENAEVSARVLDHLISKEKTFRRRRMLLQDFLYKCRGLDRQLYSETTLRVVSRFLPAGLRKLVVPASRQEMDGTVVGTRSEKRPMDVAIVTIKPPEFRAAKLAFKIPMRQPESKEVRGLRFWETSLESTALKRPLNVVVTMVGAARTLPCAIACERLFATYDVRFCMLIGIAAGLKSKVTIGDVVASELVIDYEGARVEPGRRKKRPVPYPVDTVPKRWLHHFDPIDEDWHDTFRLATKELKRIRSDLAPTNSLRNVPKFEPGVILAGEKLLANGSLPAMQKDYHDQVRAVEMEGSGFAASCDEHQVPWLVFRGISDYGDPQKRKTWQALSALSAATAAMVFLRTGYRDLKQPF